MLTVNSVSLTLIMTSILDHVGMVLKFDNEPDEIFIYDATADLDIAIRRWSRCRSSIGEGISKVAVRHLKFERTPKMLEILDQFITETGSAKYSFKLDDLVKKKTIRLQNTKRLID